MCQCDSIQVQTEKDVLIDCPLSTWCRDKYSMLNYSNINELFNENVHLCELCNFVYEVLHFYR